MKAKDVLIFSTAIILMSMMLVPKSAALAGVSSAEDQPGIADDYCLSCHDVTGLTTTLPSGEEIKRTEDRQETTGNAVNTL